MAELNQPLTFKPAYQSVMWGGRRMAAWRSDLPAGPIGESWDLADHPRGMSVVAAGPHAGASLRELTERHGKALVGDSFNGGDFPLLVKLIDAHDRLSVQVHPDDAHAQELKLGNRGKSECWLLLDGGGELFVGTVPGCDAQRFAAALKAGTLIDQLNRFAVKDGDFFYLPARTVHALGAGCLLYEIQQTCDVTFRVHDWDRVGLDGKPRELHVEQSLRTIDFTPRPFAPVAAKEVLNRSGGSIRRLVSGPHFTVEERHTRHTTGGDNGMCSIVVCLSGSGTLSTAAAGVALLPMRTYLVPAAAGPWTASAAPLVGLRLLVAQPV